MNIHLLRHGIAAPLGQENNFQDGQRVLTAEGIVKVRQAAQGLKKLRIDFDLIASSPLVRAQQTAEIVAETLKFRQLLVEWNELAPDGPVDGALTRLLNFRDRTSVLLVGHQPSIGCLASYLIFGDPRVSLPFKKGALFCVQSNEAPPWAGELLWTLPSRMLRQIAEL
ncbi:MAG: phosphohistidine phosphatase SixA [Acidobacteria bacterium]|nr:phosphohistidine phosphatase SixA [Acidobacteriota bacterium]MCI0626217.1 phosphohistidine phosphatase SixA [Acidobacteriota bacterium]MCI0717628.1 phosphohistidine phosphatase SixA [Acidobacteriota bacterium]